jgi:hypothetical protein
VVNRIDLHVLGIITNLIRDRFLVVSEDEVQIDTSLRSRLV